MSEHMDRTNGAAWHDLQHEAPLRKLVTTTLHKGRTLPERVRLLRYKRRKPKQEVQEPFDESTVANPPLTVEEIRQMVEDPLESQVPLVEEAP